MELELLPTRVSALDRILPGGIFKGGVYIVDGAPGTGKTILANQICFAHVAARGRALFVTLLAESHTRMLQHLRSMAFFDERAMPQGLYYVSAIDALGNDGLKGFIELLRSELKRHQPGVLVIDGFAIAREWASSQQEFKRFVQELQSHAAVAECSMLLLTNGADPASDPAQSMVDGVIHLYHQLFERRTERTLQVSKFRGRGFLSGKHSFEITEQGFVIYPRIEAIFATPSVADEYRPTRLPTGVPGMDPMLGGGLLERTSTGVFGPTGIGKTTFGLQFLSLSTADQPGVFLTFFESPERLRAKAQAIGFDLRDLERRGAVELLWRPQGEHLLDKLGHELIAAIQRRGVRRVFIDAYGGLVESAVETDRLTRFISALANQIRALGVTMMVSIESRDILGSSMELPSKGFSSLLEGLILMRYSEVEGQVRRLISITKIRDSGFDPFLHEFQITDHGMQIGAPVRGFEALLSGFGRVEPRRSQREPRHRS